MPESKPPTLVIRTVQPTDEDAVVELWQLCELAVPWNDPAQDIARKVAVQPELFFVGEIDGRLVATLMAGYEGHRGWINYLGVSPQHRRQGIGTAMVREAERALQALGCPKINLQVRPSNQAVIAFYEQLGFSIEHRISLGKRLGHSGEHTT
jgi:ribosomal protein S18 acetylase RimI-like enzyme